MLVAPYNDAETTAAIIENHHDEMAAVVVEPMQRILPPVPGFLQALRDVTAHYQIPLIFDEVGHRAFAWRTEAPRSTTASPRTWPPWAR